MFYIILVNTIVFHEGQHSYPLAAGNINCCCLIAAYLAENSPWVQGTPSPKVISPAKRQPISNAWLRQESNAWPLCLNLRQN